MLGERPCAPNLAAIFDKVIVARRESGASEPDVLQTFIDARYKDGSRLTNDQVLGMLIAVLFAGQHTSSITSTWTGLLCIANKDRCMPPLEAGDKGGLTLSHRPLTFSHQLSQLKPPSSTCCNRSALIH